MPEDATYTIHARCANCDITNFIQIFKGNQFGDQVCPNCGCKTLKKYTAHSSAFSIGSSVIEQSIPTSRNNLTFVGTSSTESEVRTTQPLSSVTMQSAERALEELRESELPHSPF